MCLALVLWPILLLPFTTSLNFCAFMFVFSLSLTLLYILCLSLMLLLSHSVVFLANSCPRDVFLLPAIILPASRFFHIDVICLNIFLSLCSSFCPLSFCPRFSLHVWPRFISFLCLARILIFYFPASDFLFVNLCVIKAKQINFLFYLLSVCVCVGTCVCMSVPAFSSLFIHS